MQAKLYSTVKKNKTKFYDAVTGKYIMLSPEAKPEELLGTFGAHEWTAPNGSKYLVVRGQRDVRFKLGTFISETSVCTFRVEIVG